MAKKSLKIYFVAAILLLSSNLSAFAATMNITGGYGPKILDDITGSSAITSGVLNKTGTSTYGVSPLGDTLAISGGVVNVTIPQDRVVTSSSDSILSSDGGRVVVFQNHSGITASLPSATATGFGQGFGTMVSNRGVGVITVTPLSKVDNMASPFIIKQATDCMIRSNGTSYTTSNCPIYEYNSTFSTGDMNIADARLLVSNTSTISCSYFSAQNVLSFTDVGGCAGRVEKNPNTGVTRGVVNEPTRTNLLKYSIIGNSTGWSNNEGSTTDTSTTMNGRIVPVLTYTSSLGSGVYTHTANTVPVSNRMTYTISGTFKHISGSGGIQFGPTTAMWGSSNLYARLFFDTQTCSFVSADGGVQSYTLSQSGDGCHATITAVANRDETQSVVTIFSNSATGSTAVYELQWEQGSFDTSYIETNGERLTRNRDSISLLNPYWLNNTMGTMCFDFTTMVNTSGSYVMSDSSNDTSMLLFASATSAGSKDGTNSNDYNVAFSTAKTQNKACLTYGGSNSNIYLNGNSGTQGLFDGNFNISSLKLFSDKDGSNNVYGWLKNIEWYSYQPTASELITRTSP